MKAGLLGWILEWFSGQANLKHHLAFTKKLPLVPPLFTTRLLSILPISLTKISATYIAHPTIVFLVVNQKIYVSPGITPGLFLLEHRKKVYIEL